MRVFRVCRNAEVAVKDWTQKVEKAARKYQNLRGTTHPATVKQRDVSDDPAWIEEHLVAPVLAARTRAQAGMFDEAGEATTTKTASSTTKTAGPGALVRQRASALQMSIKDILLVRPPGFSERFHHIYLHILAPQTKFLPLKPSVLQELYRSASTAEEVAQLPALLSRCWQGTSHPVYAPLTRLFLRKMLHHDRDKDVIQVLSHTQQYGLKLTMPVVNEVMTSLLSRFYLQKGEKGETPKSPSEEERRDFSHALYRIAGQLRSHGLKPDHHTVANLVVSLFLRTDTAKAHELMALELPTVLGLLKRPTPFTVEAMSLVLFKAGQYANVDKLYAKVAAKNGHLTPRGGMLAALAAQKEGKSTEQVLQRVLLGFSAGRQRGSAIEVTCPEQLGKSFARVLYSHSEAMDGVPSLQEGTKTLYTLATSEEASLPIARAVKKGIEQRQKRHPTLALLE